MTPQPQKPRILIVDDNEANRRAFESVLESGYTVFLAESGTQALELALRETFATILLDVRMRGMDGFETAELLRKRSQTAHTPIILTSAYDQTMDHVNRGFAVGVTDYIFSPVDPEFLKFKVATYVQLYLRNEALRTQVEHLQSLVQLLQADINRRAPSQQTLMQQVKDLRAELERLERQLSATPGA